MEGSLGIITFCFWCGMICLCAILIINTVLNWLKPEKTKSSRLNIMAGIAFIVLCSLLAVTHFKAKAPEFDKLLLKIVRIVIGGLMLGCIVVSVIALLILIARCIFNGVSYVLNKNAKSAKFTLSDIFNNRNVILVIAFGIISIFVILPFLIGEETKENPVDIWEDGVTKIESLFGVDSGGSVLTNGENGNSDPAGDISRPLFSYTLIYIILLGVCVAVSKILCSIIEQTLKREKNVNLIDEYSSPIALLAVGVALLVLLQNGDIPKENGLDTIKELGKSFATVIIIAAITILTLEIIRLLIDIRDNFIRREARYIFISLIGQTALFLLGILNTIFNALNTAIGSSIDTELYQVETKLRQKIVDVMDEATDSSEDSIQNAQIEDREEIETAFSPFEEKVTRK